VFAALRLSAGLFPLVIGLVPACYFSWRIPIFAGLLDVFLFSTCKYQRNKRSERKRGGRARAANPVNRVRPEDFFGKKDIDDVNARMAGWVHSLARTGRQRKAH
jgi:hypothetical protein